MGDLAPAVHLSRINGASPADSEALDRLFSASIDRAPRFGAVGAHFPESFCAQPFVASFWAPELVLFGRWYVADDDLPALTRPALDRWLARCVEAAPGSAGHLGCDDPEVLAHAEAERTFWAPEVLLFGDLYLTGRRGMTWLGWPYTRRLVDIFCAAQVDSAPRLSSGSYTFWSPELPEVIMASSTKHPGKKRPYFAPYDPSDSDRAWRPVLGSLLLLLCLALPAGAQTLLGVVSKVSDGDTLTVGKTRIRLHGIDAPEGKQECRDGRGQAYRCGDRAEAALLALAPVGSSISCRVRDVDRYGRLVAVCSVAQRAGSDLSREMVRAGWAVAYRKYSTRYAPDELLARRAGLGIWSGTFVTPEEWRRGGGR